MYVCLSVCSLLAPWWRGATPRCAACKAVPRDSGHWVCLPVLARTHECPNLPSRAAYMISYGHCSVFSVVTGVWPYMCAHHWGLRVHAARSPGRQSDAAWLPPAPAPPTAPWHSCPHPGLLDTAPLHASSPSPLPTPGSTCCQG